MGSRIAIAEFDWAVNSGPKIAMHYLVNDLDSYLIKRVHFYRSIGIGSQQVFLKGWLNRVSALRLFLEKL